MKTSGESEPPESCLCRTMINVRLKCKDQVLGEQGQMLYMTSNVTVISQARWPMEMWRQDEPITKVPCLAFR